jgi:hypothetical protein
LLDTLDLGDDVGLAMQLKVLSNAFRAEQLHAFDAQVAHYLVGVGVAVIVLELWSCLPDRAGGGEEGPGVGVRIGRGGVKTRIFLI